MSMSQIDRGGVEDVKQKLLDMPGPSAHPVLLAKYMLSLATFILYLPPRCHQRIENISEPPGNIMRRLANMAINLVTTTDELLGSVESLECTILEGIFYANVGSLRRAWLAIRRASGLAQLMGCHRPSRVQRLKFIDTNSTDADPHAMWFRVLYVDRFLSLMLGLPPCSYDTSCASEAALEGQTDIGRLQHEHCALAARILQRNESEQGADNWLLTLDIDKDLRKAGESLPSKWWLIPNLAIVDEKSIFGETLRLLHQLYHYNLLNHLHLPYLLRSTSATEDAQARQRHIYSRLACVSASREALTRYTAFRSFNRIAFCCRSSDFFALIAAMTLLLVHLNSHGQDDLNSGADYLLAHQRLSDRAMMERVLEDMQQMSEESNDAVNKESADLLQKLLHLEAAGASGERIWSAESLSAAEVDASDKSEAEVLRISVPYLGHIKITHRGEVSKEAQLAKCRQQYHALRDTDTLRPQHAGPSNPIDGTDDANATITAESIPQSTESYPLRQEDCSMVEQCDLIQTAALEPNNYQVPQQANDDGMPLALPFAYPTNDSSTQSHDFDPSLTAGIDDWAFQGVDLNFFDNLMKRSDNEETNQLQFTNQTREQWFAL